MRLRRLLIYNYHYFSAAVQICSALGANVIVTGGSDEKLELVRYVGKSFLYRPQSY